MLALNLYGPNSYELVHCPVPEIEDDEILIRITHSAICGTDLRMIANGTPNASSKNPLILGHEFSGIIEKTGSSISFYEPGMHVSVAPNYGCGTCKYCLNGNSHLCEHYHAFGIQINGSFAEYIKIPSKVISQGNIFLLDENFPLEHAAIFEPLSCVYNGQEQVHVGPDDRVMIFGAGPIGLLHAMLAQTLGASEIYLYDLSTERMQQCKKIIPSIQLLKGNDLLKEIMNYTNGEGVDVCITACPSPSAQEQALSLMATNGRILYFGGLPSGKDDVTLKTNFIHYRQLKICGSTRASLAQYRRAAELVISGKLDISPIITDRYPLSEFTSAYQAAKNGNNLKVILTMDK